MFTAMAMAIEPKAFIPEYRSIGQFYNNVEAGESMCDAQCRHGLTLAKGIQELSAKDPDLFSGSRANQLRGSEFFDSKMTVVYDKVTALEALTTIVDQGEGSIGIPESHYTIFVDLYQQHKQWRCVDYVDKPSTAAYESKNKVAYHVSPLSCDAEQTLTSADAAAFARCGRVVLLPAADHRSLLGGLRSRRRWAQAAPPQHPPADG